MKAKILKLAGVKSEAEFYKLYPTEESFMKVHGHKLMNKYGPGGATTDGCQPYYKKNAKGQCVPDERYKEALNIIKWINTPSSSVNSQPSTVGKPYTGTPLTNQQRMDNAIKKGAVLKASNIRTDEKVNQNIRNLNKKMDEDVARNKEEEKQLITQRKAASDFNDGKITTFTFPDGTTKTKNQMDWRDKSYIDGLSLQNRGRLFPNENSFFDNWINPLNLIGTTAGALATAPYEARESNSILPYVTSIGMPLLMGRSMGSGSINPLGSKFWTNEVSNRAFLNNLAGGIPGMVEGATKIGSRTINKLANKLADIPFNKSQGISSKFIPQELEQIPFEYVHPETGESTFVNTAQSNSGLPSLPVTSQRDYIDNAISNAAELYRNDISYRNAVTRAIAAGRRWRENQNPILDTWRTIENQSQTGNIVPKIVKNKSGLTKEEVLQKVTSKDKDVVSKMTEQEFENTVLKPTGEIVNYEPAPVVDAIPLTDDEYIDMFNQNIDLFNNIIQQNNKSGLQYTAKGLQKGHWGPELVFETPPQHVVPEISPKMQETINQFRSNPKEFLIQKANLRQNPDGTWETDTFVETFQSLDDVIKKVEDELVKHTKPKTISGESKWDVGLKPGQWKGEVQDVASTEYYQDIPGLSMRNTSNSVFSDGIPRRGTGTYDALNEYLKRLDLGRVKPGFNSQTKYSLGAWENFIKKNKAVGFYANPDLVYGTMKTVLPYAVPTAIGLTALDNATSNSEETLPQQAYGGPLVDYYAGKMNHGEMFKYGGLTKAQDGLITPEQKEAINKLQGAYDEQRANTLSWLEGRKQNPRFTQIASDLIQDINQTPKQAPYEFTDINRLLASNAIASYSPPKNLSKKEQKQYPYGKIKIANPNIPYRGKDKTSEQQFGYAHSPYALGHEGKHLFLNTLPERMEDFTDEEGNKVMSNLSDKFVPFKIIKDKFFEQNPRAGMDEYMGLVGAYNWATDKDEIARTLYDIRNEFGIDPTKDTTQTEWEDIYSKVKEKYNELEKTKKSTDPELNRFQHMMRYFNTVDKSNWNYFNNNIVRNKKEDLNTAAYGGFFKEGGSVREKAIYPTGTRQPVSLNSIIEKNTDDRNKNTSQKISFSRLKTYSRPLLEPYTYGFSPDSNINIYGAGLQGNLNITPRLNLSGGVDLQYLNTPNFSEFRKPTYNVGLSYRFDDGGGIPKMQRAGQVRTLPPIYTDNPELVRAYRDSSDMKIIGDQLLKLRSFPKLPQISQEEYNRLEEKEGNLTNWGFDQTGYKEDKKKKINKDFSKYIYSRKNKDYEHPLFLKNNKKELDRYTDNVEDFDIILPDGSIKAPLTVYDGKPDWSLGYQIIDTKNGTSRMYEKNSKGKYQLTSMHSKNIKPIETKYYGSDVLVPNGGIDILGTGWYTGKPPDSKLLKKYINYYIPHESTHIYPTPVQPYILKQKPKADVVKKSQSQLKQKVLNVEPIPYNIPVVNPGLRPMRNINIESSSVQQNPATVAWNVEYFDPNTKKTEVKIFATNQEAEEFYNNPANRASRKYSDASSVGRFNNGGQANRFYYNEGYGVPKFYGGGPYANTFAAPNYGTVNPQQPQSPGFGQITVGNPNAFYNTGMQQPTNYGSMQVGNPQNSNSQQQQPGWSYNRNNPNGNTQRASDGKNETFGKVLAGLGMVGMVAGAIGGLGKKKSPCGEGTIWDEKARQCKPKPASSQQPSQQPFQQPLEQPSQQDNFQLGKSLGQAMNNDQGIAWNYNPNIQATQIQSPTDAPSDSGPSSNSSVSAAASTARYGGDIFRSRSKSRKYSKFANGGDISIPQLPTKNSPLLQFYYNNI